MKRPSPLGAVARGLAAGVVATAAMTGYQLLVARLRGQGESEPPRSWDEAPAPAQVGKRVVSGLLDRPVGLDRVDLLTNAVHWSYGIAAGAGYGLVQGTVRARPLPAGLAFGTSLWALSYATLTPIGVYEPMTAYPPQELGIDLSYHLVYGLAAAAGYALLDR